MKLLHKGETLWHQVMSAETILLAERAYTRNAFCFRLFLQTIAIHCFVVKMNIVSYWSGWRLFIILHHPLPSLQCINLDCQKSLKTKMPFTHYKQIFIFFSISYPFNLLVRYKIFSHVFDLKWGHTEKYWSRSKRNSDFRHMNLHCLIYTSINFMFTEIF